MNSQSTQSVEPLQITVDECLGLYLESGFADGIPAIAYQAGSDSSGFVGWVVKDTDFAPSDHNIPDNLFPDIANIADYVLSLEPNSFFRLSDDLSIYPTFESPNLLMGFLSDNNNNRVSSNSSLIYTEFYVKGLFLNVDFKACGGLVVLTGKVQELKNYREEFKPAVYTEEQLATKFSEEDFALIKLLNHPITSTLSGPDRFVEMPMSDLELEIGKDLNQAHEDMHNGKLHIMDIIGFSMKNGNSIQHFFDAYTEYFFISDADSVFWDLKPIEDVKKIINRELSGTEPYSNSNLITIVLA